MCYVIPSVSRPETPYDNGNCERFFRTLKHAAGIDPVAAERSGQFELQTNSETYLRDGGFDQDRMLHAFEQIVSVNAAGGFPLSRIVCRMDWAAEGKSYVNDLIEFESRVNHVWEQHDDATIYTGIRVAIEDEQDCSSVLQQIAACRGAINSLLVEIIDGEIRFHVLSKNSKVDSARRRPPKTSSRYCTATSSS